MSKLAMTLLLLLLSSNLFAKNYLYLFGAGGESAAKTDTIFDGDIKITGEKLVQKENWEVHALINGGHAKTEAIANTVFKQASQVDTFTSQHYNEYLKSILQKIKSGQIKKGDQLVIQINTHGARQKNSINQIGHSVTANNGLVDFNLLKEVTQLANKQSIDTAVLDFSCFSGATQDLSSNHTCVVSASGEYNVAFVNQSNTFTRQFISQIGTNKNLEEMFLNARTYKNTTDPSFPTISTEQGKAIYEDLYLNIYKYFSFYSDQVKEYVIDTPYCERTSPLPALEWVATWTKVFAPIIKNLPNVNLNKEMDNFIQSVKKYHQSLLVIKKLYSSVNLPMPAQEITLKSKFGSQTPVKYKKRDILTLTPNEQLEKALKNPQLKPPFKNKADEELAIKADLYQQMKSKQESFKRMNKDDERFINQYAEYKKAFSSLKEIAFRIPKGERMIYSTLYQTKAKIYPNHVCRRIKY